MSLVFSDWVSEEVQRQVCKEYELTMDEHLEEKFKEWQVREEEIAQIEKSTNEKLFNTINNQNQRLKVIGSTPKKRLNKLI
jgi:hypothetical protein